MKPLVPRTFQQYRADYIVVTPSHLKARLVMDLNVPIVKSAYESQQGSTWPLIPVRAESSWLGWQMVPGGIQYPAVTSSGGPAPYSRHDWNWLPNKYRDDFYLIGDATYNSINENSTFANKKVMTGYLRIVKDVTGVRL